MHGQCLANIGLQRLDATQLEQIISLLLNQSYWFFSTSLQVYRGTLPTGQLIAIKRSQPGSMQGGVEFKTEIELLSRVHHKNLVMLLGFCFERGEQMLIYEYIVNGSLRDSLSGTSSCIFHHLHSVDAYNGQYCKALCRMQYISLR